LCKYKHAYGEKKKIKRAKVLFALAGQVLSDNRARAGGKVPDQQKYPFICMGEKVQVNNSHTDWRRTGSLYAIDDVRETYVKDNEWYTEYIMVQDKKVTIKINDKTVVTYTEPDNVKRLGGEAGRVLSSGTFALQGHDPKSKVYYKNIMVRALPD
jgi:hypothetical protein